MKPRINVSASPISVSAEPTHDGEGFIVEVTTEASLHVPDGEKPHRPRVHVFVDGEPWQEIQATIRKLEEADS